MLWVINIYIYASHSDETVDFVNHVYKHAYTLIFKIAVLFRCWIAVLFCIAVLFRMRLFISSLLILCRVSLFHDMCCTYIYTNNDMHQIYYLYTTFICQICHHPSCFCAPSKQYIVFSLYWTRSMVCKKNCTSPFMMIGCLWNRFILGQRSNINAMKNMKKKLTIKIDRI